MFHCYLSLLNDAYFKPAVQFECKRLNNSVITFSLQTVDVDSNVLYLFINRSKAFLAKHGLHFVSLKEK